MQFTVTIIFNHGLSGEILDKWWIYEKIHLYAYAFIGRSTQQD